MTYGTGKQNKKIMAITRSNRRRLFDAPSRSERSKRADGVVSWYGFFVAALPIPSTRPMSVTGALPAAYSKRACLRVSRLTDDNYYAPNKCRVRGRLRKRPEYAVIQIYVVYVCVHEICLPCGGVPARACVL